MRGAIFATRHSRSHQRTFRPWRWIAAWSQAAVVVGLPFIRVRGESALRFDVPSLKLYFFGSVVWISEAYFYLLVFLLFFTGIMLFTVLYGRIWCGWACPQTVLSDFSRLLQRVAAGLSGHPVLRALLSHAFLLAFSAFIAASLLWYFIPPAEMIRDALALALGPWTAGSWMLFSVLVYLNLAFVRQRFCSGVCPYARMQSSFFDLRTLTIAFDAERSEECIGCEACTRTCPAGIDIRDGLQVACINCAECVDACSAMTARAGKRPLVNYVFGAGHGAKGGPRPRVVGLSALLAILIVLFAYQVHVRVPVDFWVIRDDGQPFHQRGIRGQMMNTFNLMVENRSLEPAEYALKVTGIRNMEIIITRNPFVMPPNSIVKMRIYVFTPASSLETRTTQIRFTLESTLRHEVRIVREASFLYADRSDQGVEI